MAPRNQEKAAKKTRLAKKGHEKDKRKMCNQTSDTKKGNEAVRDKDVSMKFKLAQQDMKNHIDADKSFARSLEETLVRANRAMLRIAEKELSEPSSNGPLWLMIKRNSDFSLYNIVS